MDFSIASILLLDGVTNGAVYALLGLATVLVFTVTRVIFIPQGEFVAYGALTLAILQTGKMPGTVWLLLILAGVAALMDTADEWRRHGSAGAALKAGLRTLAFPVLVAVVTALAAPRQLPLAVQALLSVAIVTAFGPLVYRVAYQSLADASSLVLLIVSVGVHFAMTGPGAAVLRRRGLSQPGVLGPAPVARPDHAERPGHHHRRGVAGADRAAVAVLRAHAARQGPARHRREPAGRAADGHLVAVGGAVDLRHGGADRRAVGPADRPHHHRVLRLRLPDRPEGLRRGRDGRPGQLSRRAAGCAVRRRHRVLRLLLGQRVQGSDRVHADPAGAAGALAAPAPIRTRTTDGRPRSCAGTASPPSQPRCPLAAVLPLPDFWITQLSYIGMYSPHLPRAGAADGYRRAHLVRPGRLRRHRRLHHRLAHGEHGRVALAHAARSACRSPP